MKGTFFSKPLEWNIETDKESWTQGENINGVLRLKNHSDESVNLTDAGVAIAYAEIKKVHARTDGAMKFDSKVLFSEPEIKALDQIELPFSLSLPTNCGVTDKKASFYLTWGKNHAESHLMLKIEPKALFGKVISLLDTFYRFKLKELKAAKNGVEYKLIPPTSRDMANLESLNLIFSMNGENLQMDYEFQVRKLDTAGVTNKINKLAVKSKKTLTPREFSLGKDLINQDFLLKSIEEVISEVKLKSVF
jgi:sporulation-control protein spo0M